MAGRPLLLGLALGAALAVPAVAAARPYEGNVGPGSTITLKRANGSALTHASPGQRRFHITDQAFSHNFHLLGPGVSKKTGISFIGTRTWKLTLQVGTYKFRCDAHPKTMRGSFNVS
jgi:plastocyanin